METHPGELPCYVLNMPKRRALLAVAFSLALGPLAACTNDPSGGDYMLGLGDPLRGAAVNAERLLGDTSRWHGDPAGAALAAAQLEFLARSFENDPRVSVTADFGTLHALRMARLEMRRQIGMPASVPGEVAEANLRAAATALREGSRARAEAYLADCRYGVIQRLSDMPRLARVSEAAGFVSSELWRGGSGRGFRLSGG
jgi:hypothetical protein